MGKKLSTNKITLFNIASTIILQGLAFISGPIFSNSLGTNNYGVAAVYLTWVQIASVVFSLQAGGTLAVARVNFPLEDQPKYQSSVLSLATFFYICFSVLTITISLILRNWIGLDLPMICVGLLHGWGLYVVGVINSKFTYEFKADKNFILSCSISAATIGGSLLLIHMLPADTNYWGRIIGQAVVYFVAGLILYLCIFRAGGQFYNKIYWKFTFPIAFPTVFHLLAHIVLNQSDKVMLQNMVSNSVAGIYALAYTFSMVLNTVWSALNNSWTPFYYEFTRKGKIEEMRRHAHNCIELFTIVAMGFILLSREVFHIYANEEFWLGTDLIPLFSIGFHFVFLYSFPVNYEFYNKKTKIIALGTTLTAITNIILNYILIGFIGIYGAVIATAIAHALLFVFHYICAKKMTPSLFPFGMRDFYRSIIAIAIVCVLYYFTRHLWYIRWAIGTVLGIYELSKILKRKEIF